MSFRRHGLRHGLKLKGGKLLKRSNTLAPENQQRHHLLGDRHTFDTQTGQVYSEVTASIQSRDDQGWMRQAEDAVGYVDRKARLAFYGGSKENNARPAHPKNHLGGARATTAVRGFLGARTLQDVAIDCILENIVDVTYEGIECLPESLVRHLWYAVNMRCLLSFDTWLMFSKFLSNGPNPPLDTLRFRKNIKTPLSPLTTYLKPITSSTFDFITSLSLTKTYDLPDLVRLSSITNLGVLEIINTQNQSQLGVKGSASPVNDRVIRAWHHAAQKEGAFRALRILKLWNCGDVTSRSLSYLPAFPILAVFDVRGCGINLSACSEAELLGWKATVETNILAVLEAACVQRVPRSGVPPTFLTRSEASKTGQPQLSKISCKPLQDEVDKGIGGNIPDKARQKARKKAFQNSPLYAADETWESDTYTTFAKLGELRNDTDLAAAGLDVTKHVALAPGSDPVCPIPIVSLRLGDNITREFSKSKHARDNALAFLRLEVPTPVIDKIPQHAHLSDDESKPAAVLNMAKRRKTQVKETKKKSMTDLLNSFS